MPVIGFMGRHAPFQMTSQSNAGIAELKRARARGAGLIQIVYCAKGSRLWTIIGTLQGVDVTRIQNSLNVNRRLGRYKSTTAKRGRTYFRKREKHWCGFNLPAILKSRWWHEGQKPKRLSSVMRFRRTGLPGKNGASGIWIRQNKSERNPHK